MLDMREMQGVDPEEVLKGSDRLPALGAKANSEKVSKQYIYIYMYISRYMHMIIHVPI